MKAIKFLSVVLAVLALAFTSCSKDDDPGFTTTEPKIVEAADSSKITGTVSFANVGKLEIVSEFKDGLCTKYEERFTMANAEMADIIYKSLTSEAQEIPFEVKKDGNSIIAAIPFLNGMQYDRVKPFVQQELRYYKDALAKYANHKEYN